MSSGDDYLDGVSVTENITIFSVTLTPSRQASPDDITSSPVSTEHCMSYLSYILCDTDTIQVSIT
jgi:hypothetical protein